MRHLGELFLKSLLARGKKDDEIMSCPRHGLLELLRRAVRG